MTGTKSRRQTRKNPQSVDRTERQPGSGTEPSSAGAEGTHSATEILTMDQAISLLRTTRPTFYRWLRAGKIKSMKVGRQWRFHRGDVERFMKGEQPRIELTTDITPLLKTLTEALARTGVKEPARPSGNPVAQA